ncbi:hypothetical protein ACFX12_026840 [Malus domestica]
MIEYGHLFIIREELLTRIQKIGNRTSSIVFHFINQISRRSHIDGGPNPRSIAKLLLLLYQIIINSAANDVTTEAPPDSQNTELRSRPPRVVDSNGTHLVSDWSPPVEAIVDAIPNKVQVGNGSTTGAFHLFSDSSNYKFAASSSSSGSSERCLNVNDRWVILGDSISI